MDAHAYRMKIHFLVIFNCVWGRVVGAGNRPQRSRAPSAVSDLDNTASGDGIAEISHGIDATSNRASTRGLKAVTNATTENAVDGGGKGTGGRSSLDTALIGDDVGIAMLERRGSGKRRCVCAVV